MSASAPRARVFVSCGERDDNERKIVGQIEKLLKKPGFQFEPYVAVRDTTVRGLNENIMRALEDSEYFLFVDFKREPDEEQSCTCSLYSHQELAIAAYLGTEAIAFR